MTQLEIEIKNRYGISRGDDTQETSGIDMQRASDFIDGYHQAEKDLELTWEDIVLIRLAFDATEANINLGAIKIQPMTKEYYQEVLKRFKEYKER